MLQSSLYLNERIYYWLEKTYNMFKQVSLLLSLGNHLSIVSFITTCFWDYSLKVFLLPGKFSGYVYCSSKIYWSAVTCKKTSGICLHNMVDVVYLSTSIWVVINYTNTAVHVAGSSLIEANWLVSIVFGLNFFSVYRFTTAYTY